MGERTCGSLAHEPDAHAVDRLRRDVHDLRARSDLARRHRAERRVLAVAVVLADEEEGQLQDLAEVEALEDVTLVHRTVAEIRHGNAACRALQRQRGSRRRGDAAADDPERPDQTVVRRVHVHRAGATAVDAGLACEHHLEQLLGVDTDRKRVTVTAVGRGDTNALLEQARDPGRDRFLPRVQMGRPVDLALEEERLHELLEAADEQHLAVEPRVQLDLVEHTRRGLVADAAHATPTPVSDARRSAR